MKYEHTVKFNGKWYPAGTEIPEELNQPEKQNQDGTKPDSLPETTENKKSKNK